MSKCACACARRSTAPMFGSTKAWMVLRTQCPSLQIPEALQRSLRVPLPIPVPQPGPSPSHQFEPDIVATLGVENIFLRRKRPMSRL